MLERSQHILRIACICLAGLLIYQVASLVGRKDPLANITIPAVPSLPSAPDSAPGTIKSNQTAQAGALSTGTNVVPAPSAGKVATNVISQKTPATPGTNQVAVQVEPKSATNQLTIEDPARKMTNAMEVASAIKTNVSPSTSSTGTNTVATKDPSNATTNATSARGTSGTGTVAAARSGARTSATNSPPAREGATASLNSAARGRGGRGPELPPIVQAKVDRITDSELLAPVIRPQPMALLGIAGDSAFLRVPSGQTGVIKEGEEVGGVKLLRIGINRVLVEQDGQKKELMIFAGYGGESLLPKEKDHAQ